MPCRCDETPESDYHAVANSLAAMLCHVCRQMEELGQPLAPAIADWWNAHKEADRKRAEAEAAKPSSSEQRLAAIKALSLGLPSPAGFVLTDEETWLLGMVRRLTEILERSPHNDL